MRKLKISSRKSHLARLQAYSVGEALRARHAHLEIEYLFKESLGDKNLTDPLWKMPERGVFTEDFVGDLLEDRTDLVVHSWKDLPTQERPGLSIMATLPREDVRDVFLFRPESFGKNQFRLLTSSPRRTFSAQSHFPDFLPFPGAVYEFHHVRGNVLTRIKKLLDGEGDGLFMAKAALDRLLNVGRSDFAEARKELRGYLARLRWMVLPLSYFPTAPAQGALAIEAKSSRTDLRDLLRSIHCDETFRSVQEERKLFSSFGGGCHQKIGLNVVAHPRLGEMRYFYGQLDSGEVRHEMIASHAGSPATGDYWPPSGGVTLFRRKSLEASHPGTDLFVTKAEALPENWKVGEEVVWTAGAETWKKLASRGIWVNGTCDGLGEELPAVDALLGRPPRWTKLTHDRSDNAGVFPLLATYALEPNGSAPPLVDSYFWSSESSFRLALELQPGLKSARHAAGPGYTAKAIEKVLGKPVSVYINYQHWKTGDPLGKTQSR